MFRHIIEHSGKLTKASVLLIWNLPDILYRYTLEFLVENRVFNFWENQNEFPLANLLFAECCFASCCVDWPLVNKMQFIGTIVAGTVNLGVAWWMLGSIIFNGKSFQQDNVFWLDQHRWIKLWIFLALCFCFLILCSLLLGLYNTLNFWIVFKLLVVVVGLQKSSSSEYP